MCALTIFGLVQTIYPLSASVSPDPCRLMNDVVRSLSIPRLWRPSHRKPWNWAGEGGPESQVCWGLGIREEAQTATVT